MTMVVEGGEESTAEIVQTRRWLGVVQEEGITTEIWKLLLSAEMNDSAIAHHRVFWLKAAQC